MTMTHAYLHPAYLACSARDLVTWLLTSRIASPSSPAHRPTPVPERCSISRSSSTRLTTHWWRKRIRLHGECPRRAVHVHACASLAWGCWARVLPCHIVWAWSKHCCQCYNIHNIPLQWSTLSEICSKVISNIYWVAIFNSLLFVTSVSCVMVLYNIIRESILWLTWLFFKY